MIKAGGFILEIFSQRKRLKMCLSSREEFSPSFKTYSEAIIDPKMVDQLSQEMIAILNKQDKKSKIGEEYLNELKKTGQLLYDHILSRQVKERLRANQDLDLILTVDEKLIFIPWELLFDGSNFLCLKYNLGRAIRTEREIDTRHYRDFSFPYKMLIIANPTGDLNSSYQEGVQIKNKLFKNRFLNLNFKSYHVDSLYVKKYLRDYDIVHFAGHCQYDAGNFSNSGWLLSDGTMKVGDFILMSQSQPLPSIVFANACQSTKIGQSLVQAKSQSSIYNLAFAFLFSGVRHYIGTSWRLDDRLAFKFASEFYNQIIKGISMGKALRQARNHLIDKYGNDAIAWASYVLYGDPAFILTRPKRQVYLKPKEKIGLSRKTILVAGSIILFIAMLLILRIVLPTMNPSTYLSFSRASNFYLEGKNEEVVKLSQEIIRRDKLFLPAYKLLGDLYFRLGNMSLALQSYSDYLRLSEKKKDHKNLASAYIKIAWVHHMKGDYKKSEEFYIRAIDLSRRHKDRLNEADGLSRLAVWYIDKGDFDEAFALLTQSSEINRQRLNNPEHKFNLACDYFNIAFLFVEKDDYKAAKEFYSKSYKLFQELNEIPELSDFYFNMGEIALFEKKYQKALDYYNQGLNLDKKLNHRFNLSSDYQMFAELYLEMGNLYEAERYFYKSIELCEEINNLPVLAWVYYELAMMYKDHGMEDKARELLTKALAIFKDIDTPDYQEVHAEYLSLK